MNSIYEGKKIKLEISGGSHHDEILLSIKGFPQIDVDLNLILSDIDRRRPGRVGTTKRVEEDLPIIVSGIENNKTTGEEIIVRFENKNFRKKDYEKFYNHPRPGHVDFVSRIKYPDSQNFYGSGLFSGRMTLPMVFAGSLAKQAMNLEFVTTLEQVGALYDMDHLDEYLELVKSDKDSVGGIVKVIVKGFPIGYGGPLFQRLSIKLSQTILAIPGTKGIEFGEGFNSVNLFGSQYNDIILNKENKTKTNHSGGITGGVSNGNDLEFRVVFRPASSIGKTQKTYSFETNQLEDLTITGRHDVCYVRRTLVVVECMAALALLDELL